MSRVGSMSLSVGQALNVEEVEGRGHALAQVSATTFRCERCEMTSRIGEASVAQPFDEPCGAELTGDADLPGALLM